MEPAMTNGQDSILEVGMVLQDKWVILELIARGGMGEVYRAHQLNLKRDIALKVISREWLQGLYDDPEEIENSLQRFRREVEAMAQVRHPNIVHIFDHGSLLLKRRGEEAPIEYIAMEYIPGGTLRSTMSEEGFCPDEEILKEWLSTYFLPVLDGVQVLHDAGMVHRDLKPGNVLLDGNAPRVVDFGLARSCRLKPVTRSIDIKGTPPYMSPEQFFDFGRVDQRADIYSLGKILYEAVCGRISPATAPLKKACLIDPKTPFFQELNLIIQEATAEEKKNRISSVTDLRAKLEEAIEGTHKGSELSGEFLEKRWKNWKKHLFIGMIALLLTIGIHLTYHKIATYRAKQNTVTSSQVPTTTPPASTDKGPVKSSLSDEQLTVSKPISGKNGTIFRFIPGGTMMLKQNSPPQSGEAIQVEDFYMSETPVTNQQYVDFLNEFLPQIRLEEGHVFYKDKLLLKLGKVIRGYKPIVFVSEEGKFEVKEAMHASCPLINVTGYGAEVYAKHYGMELPTDTQWLYILQKDMQAKHSEEGRGAMDTSQLQLPIPTPVMLYQPNNYGIRALNENIGEWGLRLNYENANNSNIEYVVLGGLHAGPGSKDRNPSVISSSPKKTYADVGFRTVSRTKPE
jgi:serine/threonine protein kinase